MSINTSPKDLVALDLLRRTAEGQKASFQKLYNLTNRQAYTYLSRFLCDKSATDEVMAATYVEVWRSAKRYQGNYKVCTWILLIARVKAKRKLKQLLSSEKPAQNIDNNTVLDKQKLLILALSTLPPHHRELLGLALMPDFSYDEIAKLMNIQIDTAKSRIFSAKNALMQNFVQLGGS